MGECVLSSVCFKVTILRHQRPYGGGQWTFWCPRCFPVVIFKRVIDDADTARHDEAGGWAICDISVWALSSDRIYISRCMVYCSAARWRPVLSCMTTLGEHSRSREGERERARDSERESLLVGTVTTRAPPACLYTYVPRRENGYRRPFWWS